MVSMNEKGVNQGCKKDVDVKMRDGGTGTAKLFFYGTGSGS